MNDCSIEKRLRELLAEYVSTTEQVRSDAGQQIDDLAFHEPELFWRLLEVALLADVDVERLRNIGWGPLTWLLRRFPDDFADRVAGAARRDARMRQIVAGVEQDRVAPDVWRRLQSAIGNPD